MEESNILVAFAASFEKLRKYLDHLRTEIVLVDANEKEEFWNSTLRQLWVSSKLTMKYVRSLSDPFDPQNSHKTAAFTNFG